MAEPQQDELADALAKLASAEQENQPLKAPAQTPLQPPSPAATKPSIRAIRPASARQAAPRSSANPAQPRPPATPNAPVVTPAPPARPRPITPTFSTPTPAPAALIVTPPAARRARPAAPSVRPSSVPAEQGQPQADPELSTALTGADVVDDDDSVIVPAPDPSVLDYKSSNVVTEARARAARKKNLEFRRTLIPILLTGGAILFFFAFLKFFVGSDSSLSENMPVFIPPLLIFMALGAWGLAALNMIGVKNFKL